MMTFSSKAPRFPPTGAAVTSAVRVDSAPAALSSDRGHQNWPPDDMLKTSSWHLRTEPYLETLLQM